MKRLVLHLGMAKTGTSSIQDTLGTASGTLRARGIIYPPQRPFNHSYQFTVLFMDKPENSLYYKQLSPIADQDWQAQLDALRGQWRELFDSFPEGTCIVSAENLPRLTEPEIRELHDFVEPFFDEVSAIVYIRDPVSAIKSQWEQDVKELREPLTGDEVLQRTKRRVSYQFLERWSDALGSDRVIVRPFARAAFRNGNLLDDFLHHAGAEAALDSDFNEVESNQSLGADGTAFLLAFNGRYPQYVNGMYNPERGLARRLNLFYRAMREAGSERLSLNIRFDAEEALGLNKKIRYVNRFLAPADRFEEVSTSDCVTDLPDPAGVEPAYYVELVNRFAHLAEQYASSNEELEAEKRRLQAEIEQMKQGRNA